MRVKNDDGKLLLAGGKEGNSMGAEVTTQTVKAGTRIMAEQEADVFDPSNKLVVSHKPAATVAGGEQRATTAGSPLQTRPSGDAAEEFLDGKALSAADFAGQWKAFRAEGPVDSFFLTIEAGGTGASRPD